MYMTNQEALTEIRQQSNLRAEITQGLLAEHQRILSLPCVRIKDFGSQSGDSDIALEIALRRKTDGECASIERVLAVDNMYSFLGTQIEGYGQKRFGINYAKTSLDKSKEEIDFERVRQTKSFLTRYERLNSQKKVIIRNLSENSLNDKVICLEIALRGKTKEVFSQIAHGLKSMSEKATDKKKRDNLQEILTWVMNIAYNRFWADWRDL
jgi:hypothetical protein